MIMIRFERITKLFHKGRRGVKALDDLDLKVETGEFVVVRGPSGSGKSTLLLTAGGMLRPTSGRVLVHDQDVYALADRERALFRAGNIGFVFQMFHLVPYLSMLENVLLARGASGTGSSIRTKAEDLLDRFGLSGRRQHRPSELSAGERQRTALARALLHEPRVLLADEPTGNLDPENAGEVIKYLVQFHAGGGTILLVTHGSAADVHADRVIHLREGRIEQETGRSRQEVE